VGGNELEVTMPHRHVTKRTALVVAIAMSGLTLEAMTALPASAATPPPGSYIVDLPMVVATYVDEIAPNSSEFSQNTLWSGRDGLGETQAFLKFDVTSIGVGSSIAKAELRLTSQSRAGGSTNNLSVSPITGSWNSTTTWNARPGFSTEATPMATGTVDTAQVARFVDGWVNDGQTNNGLAVHSAVGSDVQNMYYDENDAIGLGRRPVLRVTITPLDSTSIELASSPISGPLNGVCGLGKTTQSRFFASRPTAAAGSLTTGFVNLGHDGTSLEVCVSGIAGANSFNDALFLGVSTGDSHSIPDGRDVRFEVSRTIAQVSRGNGTGGWSSFSLPGWAASRDEYAWNSTEFRIPLTSLGWSCGPLSLRLMGAHIDVDYGGDSRAWPTRTVQNQPSAWQTVTLNGLTACPVVAPPAPGAPPVFAPPAWTPAQIMAFIAFFNAIKKAEANAKASACRSVRRRGRTVRVCKVVRRARAVPLRRRR